MTPLPSLIAFGPLSPSLDQLDQVRNELGRRTTLFKPLIKAFLNLDLIWKQLLDKDPLLGGIDGQTASVQLAAWIVGPTQGAAPAGNIAALPMTVATQIVQYLRFLEDLSGQSKGHQNVLSSVSASGGGIQGFCAGLLPALAVASAKSDEEIVELAAKSITLAFCIGAYVDLDHATGQKCTSLAVRWKEGTKLEHLEGILQSHPGSYVAVIRDVRDATITAPTAAAEALQKELAQSGITWIDTGLEGRYHAGSVHRDSVGKILSVCGSRELDPRFAQQNLVRSNAGRSELIGSGRLGAVEEALACILSSQANWFQTISAAASALNTNSNPPPSETSILAIGTDPGIVPQSISKALAIPILKIKTIRAEAGNENDAAYPEHAIAVIGMGCKFPGADSVDEFWDLLAGGKSMLDRIPNERFDRDAKFPRSPKTNLPFWGNFVRDIEAFDHKFFKKSAREAASMDPQQRLLLQVAYQALESSGYFSDPSNPRDIGCYLGACSTDYDGNVGSHPPTAYSTTGTLRAFLSGRLSHYFGWSGPSLVFDTACSSSAVAIHTACTALQARECSQAVAGGVTLITSPYLYENLAAAHFLSPTGATKPFDAAADGYCRGEGVGLVVLKRLADARRDGDNILGVIAGSAVNQNANCVSITVPHSTSQSSLYSRVAKQAGINPHHLSFVEAHGTGTPVGDPVEMESIRQVFGGPKRTSPLFVSSVKGNIGHLEGASGVAALIKALLEMEYRTATLQASYRAINPSIPPLGPDNIIIPTSNQPITAPFITACINNYGAAGSNAALIVLEGPKERKTGGPHSHSSSKFPVQIAAASATSVARYSQQLLSMLDTKEISPQDLAFNLARQQNQDLSHMLTFSVSNDSRDIRAHLEKALEGGDGIKQRPQELPVVLCFGGQVGQQVGLSKRLWQESGLFRSHLDACDKVIRGLGYSSIYPEIFSTQPIADVVTLQAAIFATQYAAAKSWSDSGLRVDGIVGHSLGQFAALCVAGVLSLHDGLKLVAGRASLMQTHWGSEPGTMIAIQADESSAKSLTDSITAANNEAQFEVACYNGPTSQVIVSSRHSADLLEAELKARGVRHKRLNVTHGFHSKFTDPLILHLEELASTLTLHKAKIHIETCTDTESWGQQPTPQLIAAHTRDPVFFSQAVQRLQDRLGPSTFLEAGSDSSIVSMARQALAKSHHQNNFIPVELNKEASLDKLADLHVTLWNYGHKLRYWNFGRPHTRQVLRLPPYQFEPTKHWLELQVALPQPHPQVSVSEAPAPQIRPRPPPVLLKLREARPRDNPHNFVFDIDPESDEYRTLIQGCMTHGRAGSTASFFIELAARAAKQMINLCDRDENQVISIVDLSVRSISLDTPNMVLELQLQEENAWSFTVTTELLQELHASGLLHLQPSGSSALQAELGRYRRLTGDPKQFASLVENSDESLSLRGPSMVYKLGFQTTGIEYADYYRNVATVSATATKGPGDEVRLVGRVICPKRVPVALLEKGSATHPLVIDSFFQVASLHANTLHAQNSGAQSFAISSVERIQFSTNFQLSPDLAGDIAQTWDVLGHAVSPTDNGQTAELIYDLFVFDATTGKLVLLLLGTRMVGSANAAATTWLRPTLGAPSQERYSQIPSTAKTTAREMQLDHIAQVHPTTKPAQKPQRSTPAEPAKLDNKAAIFEDVCVILENIAEIPRSDVRGNLSFEDIGIDSLLMIEVISDISTFYKTELPVEDLEQLTDFDSLVRYLDTRGCRGTAAGITEPSSGHESFSDSSSAASETSTTKTTPSPTPPHTSSGTKPITEWPTPSLSHDPNSLPAAQEIFDQMRQDLDKHTQDTGFAKFWDRVYPSQAALVDAYILEAFHNLGCNLGHLAPGQEVPSLVGVLPKHGRLIAQLHKILADSGLIERTGASEIYVRTTKTIDLTPSASLYEQMLQDFPEHKSETELLNVTGSIMADCLTGKVDPLQLLFVNRTNRAIMADVYEKAPMCQGTTRLLSEFLAQTFLTTSEKGGSDRVFRIIEVGAGTGGTAKYLVNPLVRHNIRFEYTFTDISSSLVNQAKKTFFAGRDNINFLTLDCDKMAPADLHGKFDVVVATNCIHATKNAKATASNMVPLLKKDGVFCLVEFTRGLYWFDLVYGFFEGWFAFDDGRQHALADQWFWDRNLKEAGFQHVSWTEGTTEEAQTMRLICGFPAAAQKFSYIPLPRGVNKRAGLPYEVFTFKRVGKLELKADVYYPKTPDEPGTKRPVALMIHGGGHLLFSRQDIPMKHARVLLQRGFLPVSVDYRLCPETTLFEGPMTDCRDALQWVRNVLPTLQLAWPNAQIDSSKVLALGWSSGGQLAMSTGYTAEPFGIKPPDVILPFYSPSDLEAEFWDKPAFPAAAEEPPQDIWGELDCVLEEPILEYTPMSNKRATALSLTLKDDRARLILHMNWKGQSVPVLVTGLPHKSKANPSVDYKNLPKPPVAKIRECSPFFHIEQGTYRVPTFMVHGNADDWIPYAMTERTIATLKEKGVKCGILIPDQCGHAFDLFPGEDKLGVGWKAIEEAYDFACRELGM